MNGHSVEKDVLPLCDAHPRGQARPVCDLDAGHGGGDHYSITDDARWPAEKDARCPTMPPGMHPVMQTLIGAQYHRCRLDAGHEPPCANNEGMTWGYVTSPAEGRDS